MSETREEPQTLPLITLNDGRGMPQMGYGVWQVPDDEAARCVREAIAAGYRSIDTARIYENEPGVGEGIRLSGVEREQLFITTKLWNHAHTRAHEAFAASLERLGLSEVDLYLIHWPAPTTGNYIEAWRALVELRQQGRARSIGVSNFALEHLERVIADTGVTPAVNQIELHPYFQQRELRAWSAEHQVAVEAWSPIGQGGELLADPVITAIAQLHGRTPAQVVLRWHLQIGTIAIPKTATPQRMVENLDSLNFELTIDDMRRIAELDRPDGRIGPDPVTATF